jgi:hypothetical protein
MVFVEQLHDVTGVEVCGEYRLRLTFDDGTVGDVDFVGHEWRGVFEPLRDPGGRSRLMSRSAGVRRRGWLCQA